MNRGEWVLATLAASEGAEHTPVQVQKLFFLLDDKLGGSTGGPRFHFAPFDYGPFDCDVYKELEQLESLGLVSITRSPKTGWRTYRTSTAGLEKGHQLLDTLDGNVVAYIRRLSEWVRSLSFAELVSTIYAHYPIMKTNSVFQR